MGKGRLLTAILLINLGIMNVFPQQVLPADTMVRKGFGSVAEATDTLWNKLMARKPQTLIPYTVADTLYYREVQKSQPELNMQMMHGLWLGYWYKVEKSYSKTRKALKKKNINLNRAKRDTVLFLINAKNASIRRVEYYFTRGKTQYRLRYSLWRIEGLWYYVGEIDVEEDSTRIR